VKLNLFDVGNIGGMAVQCNNSGGTRERERKEETFAFSERSGDVRVRAREW